MSIVDPNIVAVFKQAEGTGYPIHPPFHPPQQYPELPPVRHTDSSNVVYSSVRELFHLLHYDEEHWGMPSWNPLQWLVKPGDWVFIKPNMISHKHRLNDDWEYVITHGSIIRAVVDYVFKALQGRGRVSIGDAPQTDSVMEGILGHMGLRELRAYYYDEYGSDVELIDLRDTHHVEKDGIYVDTVSLPGDPRGSVSVDLGDDSMFHELDRQGKTYYGAYYDWKETNEHHHAGKHEYAISRSPLAADVLINIPKLKTHKKCGLTVSLKSMVGINANKNWLPHYSFGYPENGGDQYDQRTFEHKIENLVVRPAKRMLLKRIPMFHSFARHTKHIGYEIFGDTEEVIRSGNWHGNDTVWRMSMDLNRILLYADPDGHIVPGGPRKRYFSIVDGIAAMEGNGPVAGVRRDAGILVGGANPVSVDAVCAALMGFDYRKLPLIARAFESHRFPLTEGAHSEITPVSNVRCWDRPLNSWQRSDLLDFKPHFGWVGNIELDHQ